MTGIPWVSAEELRSRLGYLEAARAIQQTLRDGFDPATDAARSSVPLTAGEFLIMPSGGSEFAGVKVLSVAPGNPARGLERIQGVYLLMDAATLSPLALLEGASLTALRTPAVSAAAADMLTPHTIEHLVVFGSGPQAIGHVAAMRAIRDIARVTIIGRNVENAERAAHAIGAAVGDASAVAAADLIICATTTRGPLFDSSAVRDEACVIAVGSHEPDARELDSALMTRSHVIVEDVQTALNEAGDVVVAVAEGALDADAIILLRDLVRGEVTLEPARPRVFKSTGMSWEDLVIAGEVHRRSASGT